MMKKKTLPASITKYLTAVFLLLIIVMIVANFLSQSQKQTKIDPSKQKLVNQRVEHKENVSYFEDKKGKLSREVKVDKYYMGEDGWYHLEGNAEISFLKAVEGKNIDFSADEIIHNEEATQFRLYGNSIIKYKDLVIKSSFFEYETETDIVKTDQGVEFSSEEIAGSAGIIGFEVKKEKLKLSKNVKLEMNIGPGSDIPLFISGKKLDYSHKKRTGLIKGNVLIDYGKSQIKADNMDFDLFYDRENINKIFLKGNVFLSLVSEENRSELGEKNSLMAEAEKREISAKEMFIKNYQDDFNIKNIKANGNCRFLSIKSSGSSSEILADSLECDYKQNGILKRFVAKKNVRMTELNKNKMSKRVIQGDYLIIGGKKNHLKIMREDVSKAIIQTADYRISAEEINIVFDTDNLIARDEITVILYPAAAQTNPIGFFSKDQPVLITAGEMRYIDSKQYFHFKEDVKIWQGNDMLKGNKLTLFKDTGKIQCEENVESSFSHMDKNNDTEEKIKILADSMHFKPIESVIIYKKKCKLNVRNTELLAKSLSLFLHKESAELISISAYSDVEIRQNTYKGLGKQANYNLGEESIVLLGDPVLIDKNKGETEGDKLTFSLGDGKIFIENQGKKRSTTVIKE